MHRSVQRLVGSWPAVGQLWAYHRFTLWLFERWSNPPSVWFQAGWILDYQKKIINLIKLKNVHVPCRNFDLVVDSVVACLLVSILTVLNRSPSSPDTYTIHRVLDCLLLPPPNAQNHTYMHIISSFVFFRVTYNIFHFFLPLSSIII